ncbi:MAG: spore cortex biosynthesis protein YabQ [Clostridiales bacterium]|nr:spore cortex biosynthesis protein YabQ [Clostridiales bacterium]
MSNVIRQETAVFLLFTLHGAGLTMLYDILRALRRSVHHSLLLLSFEDFLFWMTAGFLTFYLAFRSSDGAVRGYAVIGMLLGFLLYHFTLSPFIVRVLSVLFRFLLRLWSTFFHLFVRILCTAARPCRILWGFIQKNCKICKKRIEIARKKAYNNKNKSQDCEGKTCETKTGILNHRCKVKTFRKKNKLYKG